MTTTTHIDKAALMAQPAQALRLSGWRPSPIEFSARELRAIRWLLTGLVLVTAGWLEMSGIARGALWGLDASIVVLGLAAAALAWAVPPRRTPARTL